MDRQHRFYGDIATFQKHLVIERGFRLDVARAYVGYVRRYGKFCDGLGLVSLASADSTVIRSFLWSEHERAGSIWVYKSACVALRVYYSMLKGLREITVDPMEGICSPKTPLILPKLLSEAEINQLVGGIGLTKPLHLRNRVFVEFLYSTGARLSEALGVRLDDISWNDRTVRVFGKGSKERVIPMTNSLIHWLARYLQSSRPLLVRGEMHDRLFVNYKGGPINRGSGWRIIHELAKKSGLTKRIHPHIFRHSFATHLLRNGADLRAIQLLLGHANINSTMIYTHLDLWGLRRALDYHPRAIGAIPGQARQAMLLPPPATATTVRELVYAESL